MAKKTYVVEVTRISYASAEYTIEANTRAEAEKKALEKAANTVFYEDTYDYEIENSYLAKPEDKPKKKRKNT